jgi:predicted RNA-binding protein with PUA domain
MSAKGSGSNLAQAVKDLSNTWQQTKSFWHDSKSQEFERNYIDILPGHVTQAMAVIEELDALLNKIRSDCE